MSLSATGQCSRCKEFKVFAKVCNCKAYHCAIPWKGEVEGAESWDGPVYANDEEAAAEKHAEETDIGSAEYTMVRNGEGEVWVRDEAGVITKWRIEAESVPTYYARKQA
jgi:hypothetical protein